MNRPSHWIIALFAIMGPALWIWGLTEGFGETLEPHSGVPERARLQTPAATVGQSPEVTLAGRVIDALGQPIDGAAIRVLGGRSAAVTRNGGCFEVMVKVGDPYRRIEVAADGYVPVVERCTPADTRGFVVRLEPMLPWEPPAPVAAPSRVALAGEGFVVDGERRPLAGVVVTALQTGDSAVTDEIGRFLIPLGARTVSFAAWDSSGRAGALESFSSPQSEGMVSLAMLSLGEGARIHGAVRLPDGSPAAGAGVVVRHQGLTRRAEADESGVFHIDGLVPADYELEVLPVAGALGIKQDLRVAGSGRLQSELQLVVEKPLRVRVASQDRIPHAGAYVVAADAAGRRAFARTDSEGIATVRGLAAEGATVHEVRDSEQVALRIVEVTAAADLVALTATK